MQRTALFIAALAFTACDSEPPAASEARLAELDEEEGLDGEEPHSKGGECAGREDRRGKHNPAAKICEQVGCTDAQREQVHAAFARPEAGERPERPELPAAHATLAKAFASDSFAVADLDAWRAKQPERAEHGGRRLEQMSELHAILTTEQRAALAAEIVAGDAFGRHGGKRESRRHSEDSQGRHLEHVVRRVEHFCEPLDCTEAQRAELSGLFEGSRPDRVDHGVAMAAAFESDVFDAAAFAALMKGRHDEGSKDALVVDLHGVLSTEQRATLAERISQGGPRAVMGSGPRRGGKHGRHGKRRGHRRGRQGDRNGVPHFG